MADVRTDIGAALEGKLTPEQLAYLMNEVLAIKKVVSGDFHCRHCNKTTMKKVEVPDAKAVTSALGELLNQAHGRPQTETDQDQTITFVRQTLYSDATAIKDALEALNAGKHVQATLILEEAQRNRHPYSPAA